MDTSEELKSVIEESFQKNRPGIVALEGSWGCGKSHLLNNILNEWMTDKDPFRAVVTYNAWEDDSGEKPIVPALLKLAQELDQIIIPKSNSNKDLSLYFDALVEGLGFIPGWGPTVDRIQRIRGDLKKAKEKSDRQNTPVNQTFNKVMGWSDLYKRFGEITDSESAKNYKIILVVDDLDRILPTRQMELLESLYHLSQSARILILVAYDQSQLDCSVKAMFGSHVSVEKYVQKIFNCSLKYQTETTENLSLITDILQCLSVLFGNNACLRDSCLWNFLNALHLTNRGRKKLNIALKSLASKYPRAWQGTHNQIILILAISRKLNLLPESLMKTETPDCVKYLTDAVFTTFREYLSTIDAAKIVSRFINNKWLNGGDISCLRDLNTCVFDSLDSHIVVERPEKNTH